ncbi:MAG: aldo/keto reductase [Rubrivivax sp.]
MPSATPLPTRRIADLEVSAIGLGCMNLSHAYGRPPPPDEGAALLRDALARGVTLFDTAALYGFGANESLLGATLSAQRDRFVLASKCGLSGVDGKRVLDGRPKAIRASVEQSLGRLRTDRIDLLYLHRWDKSVPVEDSVGAMADLVRAGKARQLGLSEVSAATLRRAHAVHPIAAVQTEYSLWTRNPEIAVLDACREVGAAFVAFSPVARGVLTSMPPEPAALQAGDLRRAMPRFQPEHWPANLALLPAYRALAEEAGVTPAQLALAWLLSRGPHVIPIPGTTSRAHLHENLAAANLPVDPAFLERAGALIDQDRVSGPRYTAATQAEVDTEQF